jgi:hypothetical protein
MFEIWPRNARRAAFHETCDKIISRVAGGHHAIGMYESSTSQSLRSYENRNYLGLIVLITGHGQIGVAAFSYLGAAAGHLFASV